LTTPTSTSSNNYYSRISTVGPGLLDDDDTKQRLWWSRTTTRTRASDSNNNSDNKNNGNSSSSSNSNSNRVTNNDDADTAMIHEWRQVPTYRHTLKQQSSMIRINHYFDLDNRTDKDGDGKTRHESSSSGGGGGGGVLSKNTRMMISSLSKSDLTIEGIDFHCSSILESTILKNDTRVRNYCHELQQQ